MKKHGISILHGSVRIINLNMDLNKNYKIIVGGEQKDPRDLNPHLLQQKINRQYLKMKKKIKI